MAKAHHTKRAFYELAAHRHARVSAPDRLVVGKLAGVVGASMVAMRLGWERCPRHGRSAPVGLGALAGIGFTVALFVTDLAHGSVPGIGVDPARVAILAASLVAGLVGAATLSRPSRDAGGTPR
jgi:NhaA family Na+:H+ antiporter